MDFTYFIAGFIALIVGFVAGIAFIVRNGKSKRQLLATAIAVAMVLDFGLLINWSRVGETPTILLFDFIFFSAYSVVGCAIGASPTLLGRFVWRWWRSKPRHSANSN